MMSKDVMADLLAKELETATKRACREVRSRGLAPPVEQSVEIRSKDGAVIRAKLQIWESVA